MMHCELGRREFLIQTAAAIGVFAVAACAPPRRGGTPTSHAASGGLQGGQSLTEDPTSPRIAALERKLKNGNVAALEAFWERVKAEGGPLIEPIEDEGEYSLVTFLFRGLEDTTGVVLGTAGVFYARPESERQLRRLAGSDVFYHTYRFRNDLRTMYYFLHNAPSTPATPWAYMEPQARKRLDAFLAQPDVKRSDALNPRRLIGPNFGDSSFRPARAYSILELPAAPPQPWVESREDVPRGETQRHSFRSAILGNERPVWVYTPPGYAKSDGPYHLLVMFYGSSYVSWIPADRILDKLLAEGKIPKLVAVFVGPTDPNKDWIELPCHEPFADAVATELIPWVRRSYPVTTDPARTVVGGFSYAGLAASFVALRHPELFGNVLSQSGEYGWGTWMIGDRDEPEWLTTQYDASPKLSLRFYLEAGLHESQGWQHQLGHWWPPILDSNRRFRDVLRAKGYDVHYHEFNGGHDLSCWRGTFANGVMALLRPEGQ